jgi:23S rRNA (uracil1939-C5)-methyltransferase
MAQTAEAHGMDNVTLYEGPVERVLETMNEHVDLMVVDPPRSGIGGDVVRQIRRLSPNRLAYVSCDPATLARDTRSLQNAGYRLEIVQPLDMFPQTYHVESVALWVRG